MNVKIMIGLCAFFISGAVFAGCPASLDAEKMAECITVEGSGANYQDWQKNEYLHNIDASTEITNTDVRTLEPAAGTSTK